MKQQDQQFDALNLHKTLSGSEWLCVRFCFTRMVHIFVMLQKYGKAKVENETENSNRNKLF